MTEIQRYLAEEIAEDHADGLVSQPRRGHGRLSPHDQLV